MTISVLQNVENSLLTTASIAVTLTGVTAGSTIAVFATCESGRSVTGTGVAGAAGCADSVNGSYGSVPIQNIVDSTDGQRVACWRFQNSASGSPVVTVTFDASANFTGIWAAEVGGAATASADGSNAQWQATPTTSTDATTSGTITPSAQPGLIVGVCSNTNGTGATTAGTGFTDHSTGWAQAGPARFESKRYTSTTALGATFTAASNVDHVSLAMAFKEAGGGGATIGPGLKLSAGPGISPDKQATFSTRRLSNRSSPDVSVGLSGQSATFASGSLAPSSAVAITGQAATFSQGSMTAIVPLVGRTFVPGPGISPDYTKLFQSRRLSSAVSAQTDVTVALSGQAATFAAGTIAPSTAVAVTGTAATFSAGTLAPSTSKALTGTAVTFAAGTLSPSLSVSLAGSAATFAQGTVSTGSDVTIALTGQSITVSSGTLAPSIARALTGQAATFGAGTMSTGNDVTVALSGQAASFVAGTLAPSSAKALTGSSATFSAGTLIATPTVVLSGSSTTLAAGTITTSRTLALSGLQATFAQGTVGLAGDVTVALTGQQATFTAGNLSGSGMVAASGNRSIKHPSRSTNVTLH